MAAPPNGFITLNEGGRPPTPNRNSRIPIPPNHPRPPQGGGIPPHVINVAPHPADIQQLQRQAPQPHPHPHPHPQLPQHHHHHHHHQLPLVHQHDPPVRISDIRKERLTPDEAREELSEYLIFRFEPSLRPIDDDDNGEPDRRLNWESVLVVEARGVSKKEAVRQVRWLNKNTLSLGAKKATLSGAQQRQVEKVLEELQARDGFYYQTVLVQLHHQLRPRSEPKHGKNHHHHHHRGSKHSKDISIFFKNHKHHNKRSSSSKHRKAPREPEQITLTAYYKRSPKPGMDALFLYHQKEAGLRRALQPPPPPPIPHPPEGNHHHAPDGGQGKGGGGGGPHGGGGGPHGGGGGGGGWHGNKGQGQGGKGNAPAARVVYHDDRKRRDHSASRTPPGSPHSSSSDRSFFSDTFSTDDDMSTMSPFSDSSSLDSVRRRGSFHRHRPRKDRVYRLEGPMDYGIRHPNDHHRGRRGGEVHRITDEFRTPMAPPIPQLVQPVVDIEQIESRAYEAGRAAERADVERIADKVAMAAVSAVQPPPRAPSPEIYPVPRRLQRRPSVRLVRPGEISNEEATLERLERMDLRDQALEEARYILAAGPGRRRYPRREGEWEEEHHRLPPRRRPLDDDLEQIRRADADANLFSMENPFAPIDERRRRGVSSEPYYPGYRRRDDFDGLRSP